MKEISYKLPQFEGPLDLLLHLISKNKLDIYDIQISEILDQYMDQIKKMQEMNMDVSSEFLEMAARLVYIKTMSLLPKHDDIEELKRELTGQLIEYQECKRIAALLSEKISFDFFIREPAELNFDMEYKNLHTLKEILVAYISAMGKNRNKKPPPTQEVFSDIVSKKIVSVSSKIVYVLRKLWKNDKVKYEDLFKSSDSRSDLVALFLAVLELTKSKRVKIMDDDLMTLKLSNRGDNNWKRKCLNQQ